MQIRCKGCGKFLSKDKKHICDSSWMKNRKAWNKGLTKETDERVKKNGIEVSRTKKRLFKEGKIKPIIEKGQTIEEAFGEEKAIEIRRKESEAKLGDKSKGKNNSFYGKHHIKKNRKIMSIAKKGIYLGEKSYRYNKSFEELFGSKEAERLRKNLSIIAKERWKDKEYVKKLLLKIAKKPNSYEKKISELCIKYGLPFIYTGNGTFLIGRKNPDFICKEKGLTIEVFNNHHKKVNYGSVENYMKERSEYFAQYGYKTIFIREEEVTAKNWEEICLNKINEY